MHNNQVTNELTKNGVKFIDDILEAKDNVIIRSHGVQKQVYEQAQKMNLDLVDLTCPKVLYVHQLAEEYAKKGFYIFLIGKPEHPEMIGTISFCGENSCIIEKEDEVLDAINKFKNSKAENLLILSQTTFSLEIFNSIIDKVKAKIEPEKLEIKNTICSATKQRQEETMEIAQKVDMMIIVGGKHSSNSNKLYELAKKYCDNVIFVETDTEVDEKILKEVNTIGVMAGASTPQESIQKVVEKLKKIC